MDLKTEKIAIHNALHQIENYCKDEIAPKIKPNGFHDNRIFAEFGELKRYPYQYEREYEFKFVVYENGEVIFHTGGLCLPFKERDTVRNPERETVSGSWMYAKDLILNWQTVKRKLFEKLAEQQAEDNAILQFTV